MRKALLALMSGLAVAACASSGSRPAADQPPTVLEVDNMSVQDMTLYVFQTSGVRRRLGLATAHTTTHFVIPSIMVFGITGLRFQADPIGGNALPATREVTVSPGDTIVWMIPPIGR